MMKNKDYLIRQLENENFVDDGGASYESLIYYHIDCPYFNGDERALCHKKSDISRNLCFECKQKWLNDEVDE